MPKLRIFLIFLLVWSSQLQAAALPGQAAIASAHPVATEAGFEILARGGNAFDAAVAVSATLAVVEPYGSGIGGGGFWLLQQAGSTNPVMVDGREKAPLAATRTLYQDDKGQVIPGLSVDGPLAAGIPGEPAALVYIAKHFGKLPLSVSLAPAIRAAQNGFKVTPYYQHMAKFRLEALRASPVAARTFLKDDQVPPLGYVIRQPELAETLNLLAQKGHAGFYQGKVAEKLVAGTRNAGGIWQARDLEQYQVATRKPVVGEYQGYRIISAAPPSSGGIALMTMLNILSGYEVAYYPPARRTHVIVEAMRRAYRDRAKYLGDPDFVKIPRKMLTSEQYGYSLRRGIDINKATPSRELGTITDTSGGRHTTHFSILDKQGNRVAATLSINYPFGSGFMPEGTGVLLNDEMDDFSAKPGVPNVYGLVGAEANAIEPGKRMLSSMSPTFMESDNKLAILGSPGGSRIITMVLHSILGVAEGKTAKQVVSQPRYHHQFLPDVIQHEADAFDDDLKAELQFMGHQLKEVEYLFGNMQVVIWDKQTRQVEAASDPRGEGLAKVQ
ncbi:MAG: gamma-glutamyltransferase [Thioalkalispiraceae bacterium]|jgi:gamma-glutamyltranspeptidase/glutathione hydrolase